MAMSHILTLITMNVQLSELHKHGDTSGKQMVGTVGECANSCFQICEKMVYTGRCKMDGSLLIGHFLIMKLAN